MTKDQQTLLPEEAIAELVQAIDWGLGRFMRFADHKMGCACWGPTASVDPDACSCGVRETINKARALLARYHEAGY